MVNTLDSLPRGPEPTPPVAFSDFTPEELDALSATERGHLDWVVWMFALDTKEEAVKYMRHLFSGGDGR